MKDPAFPLYAQDFIIGTMCMTDSDIGKYIKLLAIQWDKIKIPKKRLGLLIGQDWDNLSEELKEKFIDDGEYIYNKRLEEEREKRFRYKTKQSINGKKGGRPTNYKNPKKSQKKPLEDEYKKENEIEIKKENIPDFEEFKNHAVSKKPTINIENLKLKYDAWVENNWKNGNDKKIKNWKSALNNTIPYIKDETNQSNIKKNSHTEVNKATAKHVASRLASKG